MLHATRHGPEVLGYRQTKPAAIPVIGSRVSRGSSAHEGSWPSDGRQRNWMLRFYGSTLYRRQQSRAARAATAAAYARRKRQRRGPSSPQDSDGSLSRRANSAQGFTQQSLRRQVAQFVVGEELGEDGPDVPLAKTQVAQTCEDLGLRVDDPRRYGVAVGAAVRMPEPAWSRRSAATEGDVSCRVAPEDCSSGAPTDPDTRISRIRLVRSWVRCACSDCMRHAWSWKVGRAVDDVSTEQGSGLAPRGPRLDWVPRGKASSCRQAPWRSPRLNATRPSSATTRSPCAELEQRRGRAPLRQELARSSRLRAWRAA
jgi:hypothetical protein